LAPKRMPSELYLRRPDVLTSLRRYLIFLNHLLLLSLSESYRMNALYMNMMYRGMSLEKRV
jgi:hypothetical protein